MLEGLLGETLSKFSIWGLYITFVLAVGRFIRLQCSDLRMRIPYENLPSCDRYVIYFSPLAPPVYEFNRDLSRYTFAPLFYRE